MIKALDNGGTTADRYTIIVDRDVFTMSSDALMPNGVNMYLMELDHRPDVRSREIANLRDGSVWITYEMLPDQVKTAIDRRLTQWS